MLEEKKQLKKKQRNFTDYELEVMIDPTDRLTTSVVRRPEIRHQRQNGASGMAASDRRGEHSECRSADFKKEAA